MQKNIIFLALFISPSLFSGPIDSKRLVEELNYMKAQSQIPVALFFEKKLIKQDEIKLSQSALLKREADPDSLLEEIIQEQGPYRTLPPNAEELRPIIKKSNSLKRKR